MNFNYEKYINELESAEPKEVNNIIKKLIKVIIPENVDNIIHRIDINTDRYVVIRYLILLRYVGENKYVEFLEKRLKKEKDNYIIATIIKTIGMIGNEKHINIILPFLEDQLDLRIIANTIEAIGMIGTEENISLLKKYIDHEDNRVKTNALLSIATICDNIRNQVIGHFNAMVNGSNDILKKSSEFALKQMGVKKEFSLNDFKIGYFGNFNRPL